MSHGYSAVSSISAARGAICSCDDLADRVAEVEVLLRDGVDVGERGGHGREGTRSGVTADGRSRVGCGRMTWEPELEELRRREELAQRDGRRGARRAPARRRQADRARARSSACSTPGSFHETGALAGVGEYDEDGELTDFLPANVRRRAGPHRRPPRRRPGRRLHRPRRRGGRRDLAEDGVGRACRARAARPARAAGRRHRRRRAASRRSRRWASPTCRRCRASSWRSRTSRACRSSPRRSGRAPASAPRASCLALLA